jgi:MFS family permease
MGWYRELDANQRKGFWACFGGWALDAMDVQIYVLVIPTVMAAWNLTKGEAGFAATAALLASSVGGVIAGYMADRIGRTKVLQLCILWFSAFTFLSGLTQNYQQLLVARALQGLGFGGEWAAGAVLMAEIVQPKYRGKAVAAVSSGWAVGYGVAVLLYDLMFFLFPPAWAWRVLFFVGLAPSLLVLFVQRAVKESEVYIAAKAWDVKQARPPLAKLFTGTLGLRTLVAWLVCLGVLGGNYTVLTWLPTYLKTERGLSYGGTGLYLLVNIAGSFFGYILGGYISDSLGRRNALKLFAVLGAASVFAYLKLGSTSLAVLLLGFPLGFAQSGMNAGVAPLLSELFPTQLRATGQGLCYNAGRGVGAFFPTVVGLAAAGVGLTTAIAAAAVGAYALVLVCAFLLPETASRQLDAIALTGEGE